MVTKIITHHFAERPTQQIDEVAAAIRIIRLRPLLGAEVFHTSLIAELPPLGPTQVTKAQHQLIAQYPLTTDANPAAPNCGPEVARLSKLSGSSVESVWEKRDG